jgi:hypothetical protein
MDFLQLQRFHWGLSRCGHSAEWRVKTAIVDVATDSSLVVEVVYLFSIFSAKWI